MLRWRELLLMNARKHRVLFVCDHNGGHSQLAESLLNQRCGDSFLAESAGLQAGELNPLVVEVLRDLNIDISGKRTRSIDELLRAGRHFDYVITVCDEANAAQCPQFPGSGERLHWSFPDPAAFTGNHQERLARTRQLRDAIQNRVEQWSASVASAITT
jgi:arsenate reductase